MTTSEQTETSALQTDTAAVAQDAADHGGGEGHEAAEASSNDGAPAEDTEHGAHDEGADQPDVADATGVEANAGGPKKRKRTRKRKSQNKGPGVAAAAGASGQANTASRKAHRHAAMQGPFARFLQGPHKRKHAFSLGESVAGRVISDVDGVRTVDLFGKATGFTYDRPLELASEGANAESTPSLGIARGTVVALSDSGHLLISEKPVEQADVEKTLEQLKAAKQAHQKVFGVVFGYNPSGFDVVAGGVVAHCASRALVPAVDKPVNHVGHRFEFVVAQLDSRSTPHSVVLTRKPMLEEVARERAQVRMGELKEGDVLEGRVVVVMDVGLVVDLDGVEGFVHRSEVTHDRTKRPADEAKVGQKVSVKILSLKSSETDSGKRERISLSMKALVDDPWQKAGLHIGSIHKGKLSKWVDHGAIVELAEGVTGWIPKHELVDASAASSAAITGVSPEPNVALDDEIVVAVDRIDDHKRRMVLSRLTPNETQAWERGELANAARVYSSLRQGAHLNVVVEKSDQRGVFVRIEGAAGRRVRGYLPKKELGSKDSGNKDETKELRKALLPGSLIEVKITGIERDGSLKFSERAKHVDDERRAVKDYRRVAASQGLGTFGDLLKARLAGGEQDS